MVSANWYASVPSEGGPQRPGLKLGVCGEHGGDPGLGPLLRRSRPRLRVLLPVPGPRRPARGGPGQRVLEHDVGLGLTTDEKRTSVRFSNLLTVVGAHAEGEVGNVVVGGVGDVPGHTMFDKMRYLAENRDDIRQLLLREPRGNVIRSANIVLPSNHPEAQLGYVVMESTEYPVMSGSNTICVATVVLETGLAARWSSRLPNSSSSPRPA